MSGFVYILKDELNKYYIGSCKDVHLRYLKHLSGSVYTTRRMKNPKVALSQEYNTIEETKTIEYKLKKLKRKDYIEKIVKEGRIKMKL